QLSLLESPRVDITLTNQRSGAQVSPHHLNKWRSSTGGLYLLNSDFSTVSTRTSTSGWYVRMKVVGGSPDDPLGIWGSGDGNATVLTVNSTLTLQVTELLQTNQPTAIGADEYILTADDVSGYLETYQDFQVGDTITLSTSCQDEELSKAQWAGGTGDVMVRDGKLTDSSKWLHVNEGRAPRTALGVKADGTLLVYAVDGRQSGYSIGLSQKDVAEELRNQGCQWVVNLDGGGSTAISVWVPGQTGPSVRNIPSDGTLRSCATYLLLVTDGTGDGEPDRLAMKEDGLVVLAGSSVTLPQSVVLDNGLTVLNKDLSDLTVTSQEDLGEVRDGVYTAGNRAGTDTLYLRSRDLGVTGTAQIHVVNALTSLIVSQKG
ncbi:MAG: phosphodiester glycosidase family protein, partial [Lawsonibacter sp.]